MKSIDMKIRKANSLMSFKKFLLRVGQLTAMLTYGIHNSVGLKILTRFRLRLSHLNEHKFKHNLKDCVSPLCSFSLEIESPSHFFLHCHYFTNICSTILDDLKSNYVNVPSFPDSEIVELLFYGSPKFELHQNTKILSSSLSLILKSENFNGSLL